MEPPSRHSISVLNPRAHPIQPERIEAAVAAALDLQGAPASDVRILLTDDEEVRGLNHRFRGIDQSTDVLTFPEGEAASGDVAISVPYARRQADARGIGTADEIVFLAIHGALHLAGLDDESEAERTEMIGRMRQVAAAVGLASDGEWCSFMHEVPL